MFTVTPLPVTPTQSIRHTELFLSRHWSAKRGTALYDQMALYDLTYAFSDLHSIFQYVIKQWLCGLQLSGSGEHKKRLWILFMNNYTYQDHEHIIWAMNTKHEQCPCNHLVLLLQAAHKIAVSCPKFIYCKLLMQCY